jgi:hypothetical protein
MLKTCDIDRNRGSRGSMNSNLMLPRTMLMLWRSLAWAMCHFPMTRPDLRVMVGPSRVLLVAMFYDFW